MSWAYAMAASVMAAQRRPSKPSVPDVLPVVRAVYARHLAGCCLHVMIDDGNVGQDTADGTLAYARQQGHADCIVAAGMLARMSPTQRRKVYATKYQA